MDILAPGVGVSFRKKYKFWRLTKEFFFANREQMSLVNNPVNGHFLNLGRYFVSLLSIILLSRRFDILVAEREKTHFSTLIRQITLLRQLQLDNQLINEVVNRLVQYLRH